MKQSWERGKVDKIKHYGPVKIDFTLHPHQVQPAHIVVTSPWFRTDDNRITRNGALHQLSPEMSEKVYQLHADGMSYADIAKVVGISVTSARYHYIKQLKNRC